jgi:hypothetical protein
MARRKGAEKTGGRRRGTPNRLTGELKGMILEALNQSGGVDYLKAKSETHPQAFIALLGKVLPLQVTGEGGGAIVITWQQ